MSLCAQNIKSISKPRKINLKNDNYIIKILPDNATVQSDDYIKPGKYNFSIYNRLTKRYTQVERIIYPSSQKVGLNEFLYPKIKLLFRDRVTLKKIKNSQFITVIEQPFNRYIKDGETVIPGGCIVDISPKGYKSIRKKIRIPNKGALFELKECFIAKDRRLCFFHVSSNSFIFTKKNLEHKKQMIADEKVTIADKILINGEHFKIEKRFSPGQSINVYIKFSNHDIFQKKFEVTTGEGAFPIIIN